MPERPNAPLLPLRPFKVRASFVLRRVSGIFLLFVFGCGSLIGAALWQQNEIRKLLGEQALWKDGAIAPSCRVSGKETSHHFIGNDYDLNVSFVDQNGRLHTSHVK